MTKYNERKMWDVMHVDRVVFILILQYQDISWNRITDLNTLKTSISNSNN